MPCGGTGRKRHAADLAPPSVWTAPMAAASGDTVKSTEPLTACARTPSTPPCGTWAIAPKKHHRPRPALSWMSARAMYCHCGHTAARHRPTTQPTTSRPPGRLFHACASEKCQIVATQSTSGAVPANPWERGNKQGEKAVNADPASARRYQKLWERSGNK